jgi:hypothetical protein
VLAALLTLGGLVQKDPLLRGPLVRAAPTRSRPNLHEMPNETPSILNEIVRVAAMSDAARLASAHVAMVHSQKMESCYRMTCPPGMPEVWMRSCILVVRLMNFPITRATACEMLATLGRHMSTEHVRHMTRFCTAMQIEATVWNDMLGDGDAEWERWMEAMS